MAAGAVYPSPSHLHTKSLNGIDGTLGGIMDDDDGRTRNAKAQRRHREKRKAHLKALEDSVQLLTAQLEDARRQLSSAAYNNRMGGGGPLPGGAGNGAPGAPLSPGSKDYVALQQENTYLREENAELRRQLYSYSVNSGRHGAAAAGTGGGGGGAGGQYQPVDGDVKQEGYQPYGQGPLASPREGSSNGRDGHVPNNDNFTPLSRGSRSRVMSSSSAPAASPYLPSSSAFPTDPRAHALSQPQGMDRYPPIRYDSHMGYPASASHSPTTSNQPPPHNLPRSGLGYEHMDMYSSGRDEGSSWGPDAGPPPFQGSVYPVPYSDGPQQEEWRSAQDHSH